MDLFDGFGHDCGDGWEGFGWFIPALILGELISNRTPRQPQWPYPPQPPKAGEPEHKTAEAPSQRKTASLCPNCNQGLNSDFAFCPHCGTRVAPRVCGYCNQTLQPGGTYCTHCGGPTPP